MKNFSFHDIEKTTSNAAMEVDEVHEVRQISDELKTNVAELNIFDETIDIDENHEDRRIVEMDEKHVLIDENIDPNQSSNKVILLYKVLTLWIENALKIPFATTLAVMEKSSLR